ncbi:MAG: choice-of-anchor tandem repeat GloVer-containing protein [Terriglobales bacterium]|jgi:uncharacterized repeat protein (TIGR03803 family)
MRFPVSSSSLALSVRGRNRSSLSISGSVFVRLSLLAMFALASLASVQAQTETILHSFEGTTDGEFPTSGLAGDGQGNFYGGASGDTNFGTGAGTVFKIDSAEAFSVVHTFAPVYTGSSLDVSGLTLDSEGNLYGTAYNASPDALLTFQITSAGAFNILAPTGPLGPSNGVQIPGVVLDAQDNAYVAAYGTKCRDAEKVTCTIVKITPGGKVSTVHKFAGSGNLILSDMPGLTIDGQGNLYSTVVAGNEFESQYSIYKTTPTGRTTVLYSFVDTTNGIRVGALTVDARGNIYGMAPENSPSSQGIIFSLTPAGKLTTLFRFNGTNGSLIDSEGAPGALLLDGAGNLWGATPTGGSHGQGTVFELSPGGVLTTLYNFGDSANDGNIPNGVIQDNSGNLFGTTYAGGAHNRGTVFKITR